MTPQTVLNPNLSMNQTKTVQLTADGKFQLSTKDSKNALKIQYDNQGNIIITDSHGQNFLIHNDAIKAHAKGKKIILVNEENIEEEISTEMSSSASNQAGFDAESDTSNSMFENMSTETKVAAAVAGVAAVAGIAIAVAKKKKDKNEDKLPFSEADILKDIKEKKTENIKKYFNENKPEVKAALSKILLEAAAKEGTPKEDVQTIMEYFLANLPQFSDESIKALKDNKEGTKRIEEALKDNKELAEQFKGFLEFDKNVDDIKSAKNEKEFVEAYKKFAQPEKNLFFNKLILQKDFLTAEQEKQVAKYLGESTNPAEAAAQIKLFSGKSNAELKEAKKELFKLILEQPSFAQALSTIGAKAPAKTKLPAGVQAAPMAKAADENQLTTEDRENLVAKKLISVEELANIIIGYAKANNSVPEAGTYGSTANEKLLQAKLAELVLTQFKDLKEDSQKLGMLKLLSALNQTDIAEEQKKAVIQFLEDNKTFISGSALQEAIKDKLNPDNWKTIEPTKEETIDFSKASVEELVKAFAEKKLSAESTGELDLTKQGALVKQLVDAFNKTPDDKKPNHKVNILSNFANFIDKFNAANQKAIAEKLVVKENAEFLAQLNEAQLEKLIKATGLADDNKIELIVELLKLNGNFDAKKLFGGDLNDANKTALFNALTKDAKPETIGNVLKAIMKNGLEANRLKEVEKLIDDNKDAAYKAIAADAQLQADLVPKIFKDADALAKILVEVAFEGEIEVKATGDIEVALKKAFTEKVLNEAKALAEQAAKNAQNATTKDDKKAAAEMNKADLEALLNSLAKNKALFDEGNKKALLDAFKTEALAKVFVGLGKEELDGLIKAGIFSAQEAAEIFNASGVAATQDNAPDSVVTEYSSPANQEKLFFEEVRTAKNTNDIQNYYKLYHENKPGDVRRGGKPEYKYKAETKQKEQFKKALDDVLKTQAGADAFGLLAAATKNSHVIGGAPTQGTEKIFTAEQAIDAIARYIAGDVSRATEAQLGFDGLNFGTGNNSATEIRTSVRNQIVKLLDIEAGEENSLSASQIKNILINYGARDSLLAGTTVNLGNEIRDHFRAEFGIGANKTDTGDARTGFQGSTPLNSDDVYGRKIDARYSKAIAEMSLAEINSIFGFANNDANNTNLDTGSVFKQISHTIGGPNAGEAAKNGLIAKIVMGALINNPDVELHSSIADNTALRGLLVGTATAKINDLVQENSQTNGLSLKDASNLLKNLGKAGANELWTTGNDGLADIITNSIVGGARNYANKNLFKAFVTADLATLKGLVQLAAGANGAANGEFKLTAVNVTALFKSAFETLPEFKLDSSLADAMAETGTRAATLKAAFNALFAHAGTGVFGDNAANADYWNGETFKNIYKVIANNADTLAAMKLSNLLDPADATNNANGFKTKLLSANLIQKFLDLDEKLQDKIVKSQLFTVEEIANAIVARSKSANFDTGTGNLDGHAQVDLEKANKDVLQKVKEKWVSEFNLGNAANLSLLKNINQNKELLKGNDQESQKFQAKIKALADESNDKNIKDAAEKILEKGKFSFVEEKAAPLSSDESHQKPMLANMINGKDNETIFGGNNKDMNDKFYSHDNTVYTAPKFEDHHVSSDYQY